MTSLCNVPESLEREMDPHRYEIEIEWTGNTGTGTQSYRSYGRDHTISAARKPFIAASSDPAFRGDRSRYNPEELLVAALSSCHMLSYLHLCAVNNVVVTAYQDTASGAMQMDPDGAGRFVSVELRPLVTVTAESDAAKAAELHHVAHEKCFIANSVNFPVTANAKIVKLVAV